jgi:hypothetical protein
VVEGLFLALFGCLLRGVAGKWVSFSWCFCGEFVVIDVTSLVLGNHDLVWLIFSSVLGFIFWVCRGAGGGSKTKYGDSELRSE